MFSYPVSPGIHVMSSHFVRRVMRFFVCFVLDYYLNNCVVSDWMKLLLPLAVKRNICIITNMGASKTLRSE